MYATLGGAQLTHKSGVDAERMLQLESTIRRIDSWVLPHNPETYVLHEQLQKLVSVERSRSNDFNFCNDNNILRSLSTEKTTAMFISQH